MDFLLGGLAACGACIFTNPLEVVKTRMQLQGELRSRGTYKVHYRNVFHAAHTIWKMDGLLALQKGLLPGLLYQFCMNGVRLGSYAMLDSAGYTRTGGRVSAGKSTVAGALAGVLGPLMASPIYMVKTHLQAQSTANIAVGHQYRHQGMMDALINIYRQHGVMGLWRGSTSAVPRVMVGSAVQLSTFSKTKQVTRDLQGLFYAGNLDCFTKTARKEGLSSLYKGTGASYFRLGPHTVLSLFFWDKLRTVYQEG
ncbi:solute carrier family 25 member 35 isoform X3 [Narcine bancroftii]|uniref:solute carrier family 25 member 35 isoform X3 n=1 Tax=Narcine bancroftii TaxID=1343680 RepID=UPI003831885F